MTEPIGLTTARGRKLAWIAPLMIGGVIILLAALWSGLAHLGLPVSHGSASLKDGHGPMMILGFLGTLISLERAVALGEKWCYLAPAAAAAGGLLVIVAAPAGLSAFLVTVGGLGLVAIYVRVHQIQPSLHNVVLASGAVSWVVAGCLWLAGWDVYRFIPWLVAFLVLTITGERLELSRMLGIGASARALFITAATVFGLGVVVSPFAQPLGVHIGGAGLIGLGLWLLRFDVVRRTIRTTGLTRYIAMALISGYIWLVVTGALWVVFGRLKPTTEHPAAYDAMLHAVFLGFVISMIFAHAPIIVPAVLGRAFPYHPMLYVPLVLLHASLALRLVAGDAAGNMIAWQWGGILNEIALLVFMAMAAFGLFVQPRMRSHRLH